MQKLSITYQEGKELKETGETVLIFPIDANIQWSDVDEKKWLFAITAYTETQYPAYEPETKTILTHQARLWNFMGDATTCSDLFDTPFGLTPGVPVLVENKFSIPPIKSFVKQIKLLRNQTTNEWYWMLAIKAESIQPK